jgi:hypothetical protein
VTPVRASPGVVATLVAAALVAAAPRAAAEPGPARVVIASLRACCEGEAWTDAEEAARAELVGLGLTVVMVDSLAIGDRERRIELRTLIVERRATAALRIVRPMEERTVGGVELWIEDRATLRTVVRHLVVGEHLGTDGARIAALKAVEVLRATVPDLAPSVPKPALAAAPSPPPEARVQVALRAGGGIVGGPGGGGALGALLLSLRLALGSSVALDFDGVVTVSGATVESGGGRAVCNLALLRAWALWTPRERWRLAASLGVGVGIAIPWADAPGTQVQQSGAAVGGVAYLGAACSLGVHLTRRWLLRLDARAGALVPEARLLFGDAVVARLGRPLAEGSLALEARFR